MSTSELNDLRKLLFPNTFDMAGVNTELLQMLNAALIDCYGKDWSSRFVFQDMLDEVAIHQGAKPPHAPNTIVCTDNGQMYTLICTGGQDVQQIGSPDITYSSTHIRSRVLTASGAVKQDDGSSETLIQFHEVAHGESSATISAIHHLVNGLPANAVGQFNEPLPAISYFHKNGMIKEMQYLSLFHYYEDSNGNKIHVDLDKHLPSDGRLLTESLLQNYIPTDAAIMGLGQSILNTSQDPDYLRALENCSLARDGQNADEILATKKMFNSLVTKAGMDYLETLSPHGSIIPAFQTFDEQGRVLEVRFYDKGGLCDLDYPIGLDSVMYFNPETGERWRRPGDVVDPTLPPNGIDLCGLEPFYFDPKDITAKQLKEWEALPSRHHHKNGKSVTNGEYVSDRTRALTEMRA